ncbi:Ubiquinone biosynthesis hydroxylase, UbiH/UbiF/VisC/COQ6 family [Beggiatoa sp. PS]|nr:Ubiquinone biosynthesis hydroxylase, UbiH/UbiF/VisC/COQ6 family [Beggiatoa sp. PS]
MHPVAGQGLNLGLRDVASLAQAVTEGMKTNDDVGNEAILTNYIAWQGPDQQRITTLTNTLVHVFSNTFPPLVMARNLGLLMTNTLPPLKKQFVRQMTGLNGHPSRLVRGLPL